MKYSIYILFFGLFYSMVSLVGCQRKQALKIVFKDNYYMGTAVNRGQLMNPDSTSLNFIEQQ